MSKIVRWETVRVITDASDTYDEELDRYTFNGWEPYSVCFASGEDTKGKAYVQAIYYLKRIRPEDTSDKEE